LVVLLLKFRAPESCLRRVPEVTIDLEHRLETRVTCRSADQELMAAQPLSSHSPRAFRELVLEISEQRPVEIEAGFNDLDQPVQDSRPTTVCRTNSQSELLTTLPSRSKETLIGCLCSSERESEDCRCPWLP
jgi:hypothetical protein